MKRLAMNALLAGLLCSPAGCRSHEAAPTPSAPLPAAATPGIEPAPPVELGDGDAYFALIEPVMQRLSIYDPPDKFLAEYGKTEEKTRNLLAAHWCVAEISNGGFRQLFTSSAGVLVPEAMIGLAAMGLGESAAVVAEAVAALGKPYPREHARRFKQVDAQKRRSRLENPFATLDERFFAALKKRPGGFDAVAAAYARGGNQP